MRSYIMVAIFLLSICVFLCSGSVQAIGPGASDYIVAQEVKVADVQGDKIELTDIDTGIVLSMAKSALSPRTSSVKLDAQAIDEDNLVFINAELAAKEVGATELSLFDLTLIETEKNSTIKQLNEKIMVTIACQNECNAAFYFDELTGTVLDMNATLSNDKKFISFETDHFSYYALAKVQTKATIGTIQTKPEPTPIEKNSIIVSVVIVLAAVLLLISGKKVFCK
ncbi:MAG: hypothetical protein RR444_00780 [Oscillospiraceae bacterium]